MGRRRPRKKRVAPEDRPSWQTYNTTWQFQLEPVSEMDFDVFIAMDARYSNRPGCRQQSPEEAFMGDVPANNVDDEDLQEFPF